MRFVGLCLLGLLVYALSLVVLFPAAPVVDRIRPQLGPVALDGVNGKLYKGVIDRVRYTDDLLPLEFTNVGWTIAPKTLLKGGAGVSFSFEGYGGQGAGLVARAWNGDIAISDFQFNALAKELESLLPVPIASFAGELTGDIERVSLANNLLTAFDGKLTWSSAVLELAQFQTTTQLGNVDVVIKPESAQSHIITLKGAGGDISMDGTVTLSQSGDFAADVLFTPSPGIPPAVQNGLRQMGNPDAQGRVRLQRQGNLNRLM